MPFSNICDLCALRLRLTAILLFSLYLFPPATHSFPYIKKRIEVKDAGRKEIILTPIEVAIDEMQNKVTDLKEVINSPAKDKKRLQLMLQGGVSTQVSYSQ